ncbi:glycosyltransferase family 2 protein [Collinsella sp. SGI.180]|uniref:glycosyltransferase family 2 protein n=1 Tax=Collinsella sp. SGI.180 TaxID=3420555 RepID=UPI003CFE5791
MINPKVSILVPICNVERYLRECLDSLVNQSLRDIEIICINDGSTDNSLPIIREYERRDERIVVIDKPNSGYGDSMNKGIDLARGEYIGIVESDDFASLNMFETLYKEATKNDLDVVRSNYYAHRTGEDSSCDYLVENLAACGSYDKVFHPIDNPRVFMCQPAIWTSIYKKSMIDKDEVRFLPTPGASFQDTAFYFKAFYAADRVKLLKDGYLHYRIDNANSSVKNQNKLFCVCDEYAEVWDYAKRDLDKFQTLKHWIPRQQYEGYLWNLNRLAPELQQRFYPRYVEEFSKIRQAGLIDSDRFESRTLARLNKMLDEPETYFLEQYGPSEPRRSVLVCCNALSIADAKSSVRALLDVLSNDDEVFVVSPDSDSLVFELKNEFEGMGRLRSDADVLQHRLLGHCDADACRAENISIVALAARDANFDDLAATADGEDVYSTDGKNYALRDVELRVEDSSTLVTAALRAISKLDLNQIKRLPDNWASLLCSSCSLEDGAFGIAIDDAKEMASCLFDMSEPYEKVRLLYGQLLSVWSSVRKGYSALDWDQACRLREQYYSMASVDALFTPHACSDDSPFLSVVVPVYNVSKYLEECLDSVIQQSFKDFEVLLINDGSTDGSLDLLEEVASRDSRVRVWSQFNCGAGSARNRGIELASGKHLIFIDPDDIFATDHVFSDLIDAMDKSGALICGGSLSLIKPSGKIKSEFSFDESFYHVSYEREVPLEQIWTDYGWIRFMYDSSLFVDGKVRFPQLNWYEDPVFFLRAVEKAGCCKVVPVDVYHYRVGYKETEWTVARVRDMLWGMGHNLAVADRLKMRELYVTIVNRFNRDYSDAILKQIKDPGVYEQLVTIQASINHRLLKECSAYDEPYYYLLPLYGDRKKRAVAVERLARRIAESKAYVSAQRLIYKLTGRA